MKKRKSTRPPLSQKEIQELIESQVKRDLKDLNKKGGVKRFKRKSVKSRIKFEKKMERFSITSHEQAEKVAAALDAYLKKNA